VPAAFPIAAGRSIESPRRRRGERAFSLRPGRCIVIHVEYERTATGVPPIIAAIGATATMVRILACPGVAERVPRGVPCPATTRS
jgi:hypothetical protein